MLSSQIEKPNWVRILDTISEKMDDGHVSVLRFTTGWKIIPKTVEVFPEEYRLIGDEYPAKMSLQEALILYIDRQLNREKNNAR
ncbi:hypothetical protein CL621_01465 [archaeon]|nr:hypothetical protein [archaeon]|tara:strand:+ start:1225 stop:1476 length:252 start_codon:yes stop_codon:yes gene_type:complete